MIKVFLPFLALVGVAGLVMGMSSSEIELDLSIDSDDLTSGVVTLNARVENKGSEPFVFLPWNTPFDSRIAGRFLQVYEVGSGEQMEYLGLVMKRVAPTEADYLTVKPGESGEAQLDLTKTYRFCADKTYFVGYDLSRLDPKSAGEENVVSTTFKASKGMAACE